MRLHGSPVASSPWRTDTVGSFGGTVTGTWGDEVLAEFDSPRDAVRAAVALQGRCVAATVADAEAPLLVGMGLDVGEASAHEEAGSTLALNVAGPVVRPRGPGRGAHHRRAAPPRRRRSPTSCFEERGSMRG